MRTTTGLWVALVGVLVARAAHADGLQIRVEGYTDWPAFVASVQAQPTTPGHEVRAFVVDTFGNRVSCDHYRLELDAVSAAAFELGSCNDYYHETTIRVVHREALFNMADGDIVPRPIPAGISAVETLRTSSRGGASSQGGSQVECTVAVHPYVTDMLHGTRVYLSPGRFELLSVTPSVTVHNGDHEGWTLSQSTGMELSVEYQVVDTWRHEVVVHDRATLSCGMTNVTATRPPPSPPPPPPPVAETVPPAPPAPHATPVASAPPHPDHVAALDKTEETVEGVLGMLGIMVGVPLNIGIMLGGYGVHDDTIATAGTVMLCTDVAGALLGGVIVRVAFANHFDQAQGSQTARRNGMHFQGAGIAPTANGGATAAVSFAF